MKLHVHTKAPDKKNTHRSKWCALAGNHHCCRRLWFHRTDSFIHCQNIHTYGRMWLNSTFKRLQNKSQTQTHTLKSLWVKEKAKGRAYMSYAHTHSVHIYANGVTHCNCTRHRSFAAVHIYLIFMLCKCNISFYILFHYYMFAVVRLTLSL